MKGTEGSPRPDVRTHRIYVKPLEFAHYTAPSIVYDICRSEYKYSAGPCVRVRPGPGSERDVVGANEVQRKARREIATLLKKEVNK
jgi:hypothetical protein